QDPPERLTGDVEARPAPGRLVVLHVVDLLLAERIEAVLQRLQHLAHQPFRLRGARPEPRTNLLEHAQELLPRVGEGHQGEAVVEQDCTQHVHILVPVTGKEVVKAAVLTVSDRASAGAMTDESGPAVAKLLEGAGFEVAAIDIVPDDGARIVAWLKARAQAFDLLFTTGGTGLAPRDVTPEATTSVLDYEVPGLAELMRQKGFEKTPMAMLSRSRAGVRGRALIVNLPGS